MVSVFGYVLSSHYIGRERRVATVADFERWLETHGENREARSEPWWVWTLVNDSIKSMPTWALRLFAGTLLSIVLLASSFAFYRSQRWVEMVSQHVTQASVGYARISRLEKRTDRMEGLLMQLRADQLSKYMWDALRANDRTKAAEWEVQLRALLLEQAEAAKLNTE